MKDIFSENIKAKVAESFATSEHQEIFAEFNNLAEYFFKHETEEFLEDDEYFERIYLGILKLSQGNISDFRDLINQAKRDWRNILYWSKL